MRTPTTSTLTWLMVCLIEMTTACMSTSNQQARRGKAIASDNSHHVGVVSAHKITRLQREEELFAVTKNIRLYEGENFYGRLVMPWKSGEWTLQLKAFWEEEVYSTPLWIYIKKDSLPSNSDFLKASISFISRGYARVREEAASPGPYFVMVEALRDMRNLTIVVEILPTHENRFQVP